MKKLPAFRLLSGLLLLAGGLWLTGCSAVRLGRFAGWPSFPFILS